MENMIKTYKSGRGKGEGRERWKAETETKFKVERYQKIYKNTWTQKEREKERGKNYVPILTRVLNK